MVHILRTKGKCTPCSVFHRNVGRMSSENDFDVFTIDDDNLEDDAISKDADVGGVGHEERSH